MRALLVGLGRAGLRHYELLRELRLADAFAIVDVAPERRALVAGHDGVAVFDSLAGALAARPLDFAIVATPPAAHLAAGEPIAAAGVACLIEKPVASPGASLSALRRAARAGAVVSVVSQHRFAPDVPRLHEFLRSTGVRGELRVRRNRSAAYLERAAADPSGASGVAFTIGVHWVDLLVAGLGPPAAIERGAGRHEHGVQVAARALLRWPGAAIALDLAWGPDVAEHPDTLTLRAGAETVTYAGDCLHAGSDRCAAPNRGLIGAQLRDFVAGLGPAARGPKVTLDDAERALRACEALL